MGCTQSTEAEKVEATQPRKKFQPQPSTTSANSWTTQDPASSRNSSEQQSHSNDNHEKHSTDSSVKRTLQRARSAVEQVKEIRKEDGDLKTNVVHLEVPFGKPIEEVYDGVHDGPILGSGIAGEVRLVTHKATGHKYAVKCLDLGQVKTEEGLRQLREEIVIMCQLDHPNIVRLEEVYESFSQIYLVQELCVGGDLFDRLDEQPDYHYTEAQCAMLVKQMLAAVRYLHSKGIIHRDLKLENFLFSSKDPDSELKMIDFGLSKHFKFGEVHHEAVGTPYTIAPEIIRGTYDEKCDVWAIGVLTYLLLSGDSPFGGCGEPGQNMATVRCRILRGTPQFMSNEVWSTVSENARDFIKLLLTTDPKQRPTSVEAQQHPWIRECCNHNVSLEDQKLRPEVVQALVSFKEFSDVHKLLCEVLSFTLLPEQIRGLRKEFEKMDTDDSGEISLCALKKMLVENAGAGSLGALTEEEVEDVFNAMRVRKSEQRIQWHEFIAASISQCHVDERNLRLAFDRLDNEHKGFISIENVMDVVGNDQSRSEEAMRDMWGESMKSVNCMHARITYEDFVLLMKGQGCVGLGNSPYASKSTVTLPPSLPEGESISLPFGACSGTKTPIYLPPRAQTSQAASYHDAPLFEADSRRVLLLPEHEHKEKELDNLIKDPKKSPLVVNRTLYRAHRQMRLAVLEASKRFEEEQARRARETLMAQPQQSTGAGLVMRHHRDSKEVSAAAVKRFVSQRNEKRRSFIEAAKSRGGRGGRIRQKTISDMSCMMASLQLHEGRTSAKQPSVGDEGVTLSYQDASTSFSLGKSPSLRTFGNIESVFPPSEEIARLP